MSDLELEKIKKEFEEKIAKQQQEMFANDLEETKDDSNNRAKTTASINVGNFTLIYGCQPGEGVNAASKFIADLVNLYTTNFDPENGQIVIPDVYSKVLSSDAKIESVTCNEARKLFLEREDDLIGHKRLVYAIDKADQAREPIRKATIDFFKTYLGFTDDEIIFVDRTEFEKIDGVYLTKFSDETTEKMNQLARSIFEDPQHGLAKQVLNIAICEA